MVSRKGGRSLVGKRRQASLFGVCAVVATHLSCGSTEVHRHFELTVLGPAESLDALHVSGLRSGADTEQQAGERTFLGDFGDWDEVFVLELGNSTAAASRRLRVEPWLCRRVDDAERAVEAGGWSREKRIVEVDSNGRFWTNGRLGESFPTICEWAQTQTSGFGLAALQDGPSLCSDSDRSSTVFEVTDETGKVVSTPEACVSLYGGMQDGTVGLTLTRDRDTPENRAMTFSITHCLSPGQTAPFEVSAEELAASTCTWEGAHLSVGEVSPGSSKPVSFEPVEGYWRVQAASPDRKGRHRSSVDLRLVSRNGDTLRVVGEADLPQVLH